MSDNKSNYPPQSESENSAQDPIETVLGQADFARANPQGRAELRQRLMVQASQRSPRRPGRALRVGFEVIGLSLLAIFFLFAVTRLMEHQPLIPGAQPPTPTTVSPTFTPTPPDMNLTPTPPTLIDMSSSADAVRLAISSPTWNSLWVEAEIAYYPVSGDTSQPDTRRYTQAWLEKGGRWLALTSPSVPAQFNFNLDVEARTISVFDGKTVSRFDKQSGATSNSTVVPETPEPSLPNSIFPLDTTGPALELVYPGFLWILSSEPQPLRTEFILNRWAVVADWGNSRLWVDTQTGLLLKVERYTGKVGDSPLSSVLTMRQLLVDPHFDDAVFAPQHLNELAFQPAPGEVAVQPQATPTAWASYSPQGWWYIQAADPAPFEWQVFSLPASCLFGAEPCAKNWQVTDNPNLQITGMYWSPDHTRAIFSDTNNNQLVVLDVKSRQWLRVVNGFFQPQLTWSPDGSRIAALGEGSDPYDMRLVVVNSADWSVKDVPTTLKGVKRVIGWLDGGTLIMHVMPQDIFKGGAPDWVATDFHPGFYRLDVETGKADLLPVNSINPFDLALSPDGKQFTYWLWDENQVASIYLASPDGSHVTKTGLQGNFPGWSPDGQWLLFQQTQAADQNQPQVNTLLLAHPDGSALQKVLVSTATLETAWSPDSNYLLISEFGNTGSGAYSVSLYDIASKTLKKIDMPAVTGSAVLNLLGWEP